MIPVQGYCDCQDADGITSFDDADPTAAVNGFAAVTLRTYTGEGEDAIFIAGDGDVNVQILYSVDGGGNILATTSDQRLQFSIGFKKSLAIIANNLAGTIKNHSTVSNTGVYS